LEGLRLDEHGWSAADVIERLDRRNRAAGRYAVAGAAAL